MLRKNKSARVIKPLSDRFLFIVAFSIGSAIALLSTLTDQLLMRCNLPAATALIKWNAAAGVLSVIFVWKLLHWTRERNELLRERDRIAWGLNHELRNAMQVISLHDFRAHGNQVTETKLSIRRIELAMNEYLPDIHAASPSGGESRKLA